MAFSCNWVLFAISSRIPDSFPFVTSSGCMTNVWSNGSGMTSVPKNCLMSLLNSFPEIKIILKDVLWAQNR